MKLSQLSLADYNQLDSIPVINQDLSASGFTPVANTYYRHTGATTDTFTQGVIYCYDGTKYKALDGSGGGGTSDVKVNGTSVVTDGVANIPPASETSSGIVTDGKQTFSGVKKIKASPSGYVQLELEPNAPTSGRAYSKMRFNSITQEGSKYQFNVGMSQINTLSFAHISEYTSTDFSFSNYNGQSFLINVNTGGYSRGQVNCGANKYQLYLNSQGYYNAVPISNGTLMSTPSTWSSGTSGSLTLTESGTYQFYSGSGAMIINYTLLYVELGKDSIAYAGKNVQLEIDTNNVVHIYDMSQEQPVEKTITLKYRRIGL